jgi:hypothetical protein
MKNLSKFFLQKISNSVQWAAQESFCDRLLTLRGEGGLRWLLAAVCSWSHVAPQYFIDIMIYDSCDSGQGSWYCSDCWSDGYII